MFRIIARAQHTWLRLPWIELFLVGLFAIQVPFSCSNIELDTLGSPLGKLNRISNFVMTWGSCPLTGTSLPH
jgi:hypothetical protein